MNYEINISLNGTHFFATHERSITSKLALEKVYPVLKEKFPEEEGYKISITLWETIGKSVDVKALLTND